MRDGGRGGAWTAAAAVVAWSAGVAISARGDLWLGLGATAIALGALVAALRWRQLRPAVRWDLPAVAAGAVVGVVMAAATHVLYARVAHLFPGFGAATGRLYARLGAGSPMARALFIVPIAAGEELVWRGAVQAALRQRFAPAVSVLLAAGLYALAHAPLGAPLLVAALGCGLVWGALRAATGTLAAPFVAHVVWDQAVLFVAPLVAPPP